MTHPDLEAVDGHSPVRSVTSFDPLRGNIDDDVSTVAASMHQADCGALLIDDELGDTAIVTERDVVRALAANRSSSPISDYMTRDLIVVPGDMTISDAALTMHQAGVRHLAVDRGDGVLGITSIKDLLEPLLDTIGN